MEATMTEVATKPVRVFVTNYAGHIYDDAERFGKLIFITRGFVNFSSPDRLKYYVAEGIKESSPDDYLLLSGSALLCTLISMIWLKKNGKIKILNWDKKSGTNGQYREMIITDKNISEILESLTHGKG